MHVVKEKVIHRQFGAGVVTDQDTASITVEFKGYGAKKFLYPSAFESFLELCDPVSKQKMCDELRELREQAGAERHRQQEEEEKLHDEERRTLAEHKRAAARKRMSAKKTPAKAKKPAGASGPAGEGAGK